MNKHVRLSPHPNVAIHARYRMSLGEMSGLAVFNKSDIEFIVDTFDKTLAAEAFELLMVKHPFLCPHRFTLKNKHKDSLKVPMLLNLVGFGNFAGEGLQMQSASGGVGYEEVKAFLQHISHFKAFIRTVQ
jgi:hypothetical protein